MLSYSDITYTAHWSSAKYDVAQKVFKVSHKLEEVTWKGPWFIIMFVLFMTDPDIFAVFVRLR